MASASIVLAEVFCPHCVERVERPVRFSYGDARQALRLGERLAFAPGSPGTPGGRARVVADGLALAPCPRCSFDGDWPVEVWIERDQLADVRAPSRRFNWVNVLESFIVIDD